jgi:hypothetical protein
MRRCLLLTVASFGCSGPLSGPLAFDPSIQASGGTVVDGGFATDLSVVMASFDQGGTDCAAQLALTLSGRALVIRMWNSDGSIVIPAVYQLGSAVNVGTLATIVLRNNLSDGGWDEIASAASGTVTLTNIRSLTTGSFTAMMVLPDGGSGGQLTGNFDPLFCGG